MDLAVKPIIFSLIAVLFGSLLVNYLWIFSALKNNWLDRPTSRKRHKVAIPTSGGVGLMLVLSISGIFFLRLENNAELSTYICWGLALWGLVILGFLDDLFAISALLRLVVQAVLAVFALVGPTLFTHGPTLAESLSWTSISLPYFGFLTINVIVALALSVIWVLLCINMLNFIDGVNGLASSQTIVILAGGGILAHSQGKDNIVILSLLAIAALAGFLPFNFANRLFLGDAGSYFCGGLIAMTSSIGLLKTATLITLAPVLILLLYPLGNIIWVVSYRLSKRLKPWQADNMHWHDLLRLGGKKDWLVTAQLFLVSLFSLMFALSISASFNNPILSIISLALLLISIGVLYHQAKLSGAAGKPSSSVGSSSSLGNDIPKSSASGSPRSSTNNGSKTG